jgi:probable F420-dependent oxidoreductase
VYGLTIFSGGYGPRRFARAVEIAREAESAGFDAVWTSELYSRSATIPLALWAQATERVQVGTNIAYGVGRTPLMWAAEARDLDELSAGRLILGLGNGTARMMEDWHGVSGESPATRMQELVEVLRKLWKLHEGPVHHDGRFYRLHLNPTSDTPPPFRARLPIWTAGVNTGMLRAAGRVADGLVGHPMFTGQYVQQVVRPELALGAQKAGRDPGDIAVMGILMCAVGDDEEAGRRSLAFAIAQYAASRVYDRLFELHGWTAAQQVIREAAKARDTDALIAAVPDDAIDAVGVACTQDQLAERVAKHAGDYDHLDLVSVPWGLTAEQAEQSTVAILDGMRPALSKF